MTKRMLIDAQHPEETRVVIADENQIYDFDFVSTAKKQLKGNIYLAKITRVEPSLQAAFVEYGGGKQGFLPFSEIHADYYQIPTADRQRLMEEASREDSSEETATETTSDQPTISSDVPPTDIPMNESADFAPISDMPEVLEPAMTETENENDRPAYLMQGAIDTSISEYVEPLDIHDDNTPIAQPLDEPEQPVYTVENEGISADMPALEAATGEAPAETSGGAEAQASETVETLSSEEDEYRPKKNLFFKRYKIQEVIRRGQIVLVQVIKEERGNKGCSLTTYLSLAGRYCVLMPNSPKDGGISRKIASADDRKRLKSISTELRLATGMSVIIRTAGMDRTHAEIKRDYDYLVKLWNQIREDTLKSNAPALIYEESDIIKRAIRDQYSSDIDELVVAGDEGYNAAKEFMKLLLPSHTPKIKHYKEATPLFYAYDIEEQLLSMHDPVVKLKSGGYLVINPTEALISIDVNSGRATGERNIEETALKTNMEAAAEVARQLRLRDLAGLIVIDLIDMMESRNRRAVEKMLKDSLKADRAKIQIGRISPFGLMEMSRQRLRPSISESNMVQCPHCVGRGVVRSNESMSIQMIRAIEKEASLGTWSGLRLIAPQEVALHLLNTKRDALRGIEERHSITVQVLIDTDLSNSEFNLEKMRRNQGHEGNDRPERNNDRNNERRPRRPERERAERNERPRRPEISPHDDASNDNIERAHEGSVEVVETPREDGFGGDRDRNKNRPRRRGGRNRNRNDRTNGDRPQQATTVTEGSEQPVIETIEGMPTEGTPIQDGQQLNGPAGNQGRPPRNRGGRGRRRWRDRDDRGPKEGIQENAQHNVSSGDEPVQAHSDGNTLPAFATETPVLLEPERKRSFEPVIISQNTEPTPSETSAPAKKGWWQKMIDLDD